MRRKYTDDGLDPEEPQLGPGERLHVPIMHDKTIVHANELRHRVYVCDGKMPLRKKGQGRAIHVSDFIVEQTGRLARCQKIRFTRTPPYLQKISLNLRMRVRLSIQGRTMTDSG